MNSDYLKPFDSGRSLQSQITVRRMNDLQRAIPRIRFSGTGARISNIGGQTFVTIQRQIQNSSSTGFPFQVITRADPNNQNQYQASVYWNSSLLKSINITDRKNITGLANAPMDAPIPGDGNPNWFSLIGNDFIWLEIVMSSFGVINTATIASYGLGSAPTYTPGQIPGQSDGIFIYTLSGTIMTQTNIRVPIAYTLAGPTGAPILYQMLNSNIRFDNVQQFEGATADSGGAVWTTPIYYPVPVTAPYIG